MHICVCGGCFYSKFVGALESVHREVRSRNINGTCIYIWFTYDDDDDDDDDAGDGSDDDGEDGYGDDGIEMMV